MQTVLTASSRFELELKKVINAEITRISESLVLGHAISDYAKYQYYVGRVAGLTAVLTMHMEEANRLIEER